MDFLDNALEDFGSDRIGNPLMDLLDLENPSYRHITYQWTTFQVDGSLMEKNNTCEIWIKTL